jgi:hypothetical protein
MLDEHETQAPPAAAPEAPAAADFHPEDFMPKAPPPSPAQRWAMPLLIGIGAGTVVLALGVGTLWMRDENKANASLDVLASSTRASEPAAAATAPAASTLPPLVMLEPNKAAPVAPAPAAAAALPPAPLAKPAAAALAAPSPAPQAHALARPEARHGVASPAPKPKQHVALQGRTLPPPRTLTLPPPSGRGNLLAEQMRRCKTGDLARDCLDDLCRHGGRNDPACRARKLVD